MAVSAATVTTIQRQGGRRRPFLVRNARLLFAYAILAVLLIIYHQKAPRFTEREMRSIANQGMTLTCASLGQTVVVLTGGIDLSVGPMVSLTNSAASRVGGVDNPTFWTLKAVAVCLAIGALGGLINGLLVAYGRLQPIIVTLATGSIYSGLALYIRPNPGGEVPFEFGDKLTGLWRHKVPDALFLLAALIILWLIFRKTTLRTRIFAIGSSQGAAYMSGVNVAQTKVVAYTVAGIASGVAGLFLTAQTASGDANAGSIYTLNSIAAVVLGGASLAGGSGSFIGSIAGSYVIAIIPSDLLFFKVSAFYQSFFQGLILLVAVSLGAFGVLRVKNRMERL
ncbi:MAG: ABC transporter permease [Thermomicrobiales bacterium]